MPAPIPDMGEAGRKAMREEFPFKAFSTAVALLAAVATYYLWKPAASIIVFFFTIVLCYLCRMIAEVWLSWRSYPCTDIAVLLNRRLNKWFGWDLPA